MPIKAKPTNNTPSIEPGMYPARCFEVIHLGTVYSEKWGKFRDEVRIGFELPTEMVVFDEAKGEQPRSISKKYTLSMYEKANLRMDIESWLGKSLPDDQADDFDILDLVGQTCMINIVHSEDGKYANIRSVNPLPKGTTIADAMNPPKLYDYDANFDPTPHDKFPDFIADRITESSEYKERIDQLMGADEDKKHQAEANQAEELPVKGKVITSSKDAPDIHQPGVETDHDPFSPKKEEA